jgi:hypothetical protein
MVRKHRLPPDALIGQLDNLQNHREVWGLCARLGARISKILGWFDTTERGILNGGLGDQNISGLNAVRRLHANLLFMTASPADRPRAQCKVH